MSEHHANHPEEIKQSVVVQGSGNSLVLPAVIILAALFISGSILYSGKKTVESLDLNLNKLSSSGNLVAAGGGQQALNQQVQPTPAAPVDVKDRSGQPFLGKANAKVTMYEFSDFQCPFCQAFFSQAYKEIKSKYIDTGKVKLVYRHFPLPFHKNAEIAAVAAECANLQGKFGEYHDLLFINMKPDGTGLEVNDLKKYADTLGLNSGTLGFAKNKFNQCLDNKSTLEIVKKDTSDGSSYGVSGTPTFYVNGKQIVGAQPFAIFEQAIEEALTK